MTKIEREARAFIKARVERFALRDKASWWNCTEWHPGDWEAEGDPCCMHEIDAGEMLLEDGCYACRMAINARIGYRRAMRSQKNALRRLERAVLRADSA